MGEAVDGMDEADRVLARLARIERLDLLDERAEATTTRLLDELRALIREAEDWARTEGDARARLAVSRLRESRLREEAAGMR
jgi:hypothetical protein